MIPLLNKAQTLLRGQSYWKVKLTSGKEFSEIDTSFDLLRGMRPIDWSLDVVGSGDNARIAELCLVTPQGTVTLAIHEPYTAFQLKRGYVDLFSRQRTMEAQIIGKVTDKESGRCEAAIWDVKHQRLITDFLTNVNNFATWHPDVTPIGAFNLEVVGVCRGNHI